MVERGGWEIENDMIVSMLEKAQEHKQFEDFLINTL